MSTRVGSKSRSPSIVRLGTLLANRIAKRLAIIFSLGGLSTVAYLKGKEFVDWQEANLASARPFIAYQLRLGDTFQLHRYLNVLSRSRNVGLVRLEVGPPEKRLLTIKASQNASATCLPQTQWSDRWILCQGALFYIVIEDFLQPAARLMVHYRFDWFRTLAFGLAFFLVVFGVTLLLVRRGLGQLSQALVTPVVKLSGLLEHNHAQAIDANRFEIHEIQNLATDIARSHQRLKDYEQASREQAKHQAIAKTTQMLAHDIRRPLGLMTTFLRQLAEARSFDEMKATLAQASPAITSSARSLHGMIDDVMEIDRRTGFRRRPESLHLLIGTLLSENQHQIDRHRAQVQLRLEHTRQVHAHFGKVKRVFANILLNALEALDADRQVWVRSRQHPGSDHVEVTFGNNGPTIAEEDRLKLFTSFFTRGKTEGTGLGLAIARKIIGEHSGEITCQSPGDECAVEFTITLPAADQRDSLQLPSPAASLVNRDKVVLIEDDEIIRHATSQRWSMHAEVLTFRCPEEFLDWARDNKDVLIDTFAVVVDFHFAGSQLDGGRLTERLRTDLGYDRVVILFTNESEEFLGPMSHVDFLLEKELHSWPTIKERCPDKAHLLHEEVRFRRPFSELGLLGRRIYRQQRHQIKQDLLKLEIQCHEGLGGAPWDEKLIRTCLRLQPWLSDPILASIQTSGAPPCSVPCSKDWPANLRRHFQEDPYWTSHLPKPSGRAEGALPSVGINKTPIGVWVHIGHSAKRRALVTALQRRTDVVLLRGDLDEDARKQVQVLLSDDADLMAEFAGRTILMAMDDDIPLSRILTKLEIRIKAAAERTTYAHS